MDTVQVPVQNPNKKLSAPEVLECLKNDMPDLWKKAEVVGKWVWLNTGGKPDSKVRQYLTDLGFRFNGKRELWQHACGVRSKFLHRGDPRHFYSTTPAEQYA